MYYVAHGRTETLSCDGVFSSYLLNNTYGNAEGTGSPSRVILDTTRGVPRAKEGRPITVSTKCLLRIA